MIERASNRLKIHIKIQKSSGALITMNIKTNSKGERKLWIYKELICNKFSIYICILIHFYSDQIPAFYYLLFYHLLICIGCMLFHLIYFVSWVGRKVYNTNYLHYTLHIWFLLIDAPSQWLVTHKVKASRLGGRAILKFLIKVILAMVGI